MKQYCNDNRVDPRIAVTECIFRTDICSVVGRFALVTNMHLVITNAAASGGLLYV